MKERLFPPGALKGLAVLAGIAEIATFSERSNQGNIRFLESWSDPDHTVGIVQREDAVDVYTRDNRHAILPGRYESYWKDPTYLSVGSEKDGACFVAIFRNNGDVTIIQDDEINAYRIMGISDKHIQYYRIFDHYYDVVIFDRKNNTKTIEDRHYVPSYYTSSTENHPC